MMRSARRIRRRTVALATAVALALSVGVAALADEIDDSIASLKKDAPYEVARLPLFAAGWVPAPEDTKSNPEVRCSYRTEICLAYPETEACSGTGLAHCAFRFTKDGAFLSITTVGEPVTGLIVSAWRLDRG